MLGSSLYIVDIGNVLVLIAIECHLSGACVDLLVLLICDLVTVEARARLCFVHVSRLHFYKYFKLQYLFKFINIC